MSAPFRFFPTGALILLAVMTAISAVALVVQWREAKHAPFFLLRYEAAKRARRLLLLTVLLVIGMGITGWLTIQYLRHPTEAPARPAVTPAVLPTPTTAGGEAGTQPPPTPTRTRMPSPTPTPPVTPTPSSRPMTRSPGASFTFITFAQGVSASNEPLMPGQVFSLPLERPIYAFFRFAEMENGTPWRAVWRKGSVELVSDEFQWEWGRYGTAYVYFLPPGGFDAGAYSLQLYIGDDLQFEASFEVQ